MTRISLIVIACLAGLLVTVGWLLKKEISSNSVLKVQLSESQQTLQKYESQQKIVEAVDQKFTKGEADAKATDNQVNTAIRTHTIRLYIPTRCVPPSSSTPSDTDATSRTELEPAIAQDIIAITQRGDSAIRQLIGLQDYVKTVCLTAP